MKTKVWDAIDVIASREAEALRKARQFRSVSYRHTSGIVNRDQAVWDEHLEVHYTHCSFCGTSLNVDNEETPQNQPAFRAGKRVSLFLKDIDICPSCMYLRNQLVRSCPVRSYSE